MDDEIHWCWEQCCDQGPHACICGNDCEPPRSEPYTMTTAEVKAHYVFDLHDKERGEAFDRWLAGVRAEARAEALREMSNEFNLHQWVPDTFKGKELRWLCEDDECLWWNMSYGVQAWLRERADRETTR